MASAKVQCEERQSPGLRGEKELGELPEDQRGQSSGARRHIGLSSLRPGSQGRLGPHVVCVV